MELNEALYILSQYKDTILYFMTDAGNQSMDEETVEEIADAIDTVTSYLEEGEDMFV